MSCPDETALTLFLAGELSDDAGAGAGAGVGERIDAHIDGCPECFELLAVLAGAKTPTVGRRPEAAAAWSAFATGPHRARLRRGTKIGRYVLLELIGVGGMGTVYAAADPDLGRTIALKLVAVSGEAGPAAVVLEARMMAQVSHRNVVPVFDVGAHEGSLFIAMELIEGKNLRAWLEEDKRRWRQIVQVFVEAARGLSAAHDVGLVHRDFKPDRLR